MVLRTCVLMALVACGGAAVNTDDESLRLREQVSGQPPAGTQDELEGFVEMALQAQLEGASVSEEEAWQAARGEYEASSTRYDFPRSLCSWKLFPSDTVSLPFEEVSGVSAQCEGTRCVAWVSAGETYALHLLFDESGHLRATALGEGHVRGAALPAAPETLNARSCPLFEALLDDGVGDDVYVIGGGAGDEDDAPYVARLCGEAATERVELAGDEFVCAETGCVQLQMCGNTCTRVAGEVRGGETQIGVLIDTSLGGDSAPSVDAAQFAAWRGEIECGDSLELSADFVEGL